MKAGIRKKLAALLLALILTIVNITPVFALGGRYVRVKYDGQVLESITVDGVTVNAIYKAGTKYEDLAEDPTYSCAAFVKRFYSKVYGMQVYNFYENSTPRASGVTFVPTRSPKVGDIVRDNQKIHWAVVKAVNGNTVTIAHQNYSYTSGGVTYGKIGCTLNKNDSRYTFFTCNLNTKPVTVSGVKATAGEHQNKISWASQSQAGYIVECKTGDGKFEKIGTTESTSFTHKGLTTGTTYEYRIKAYRQTADGTLYSDSYSKTVSATPYVILPATPQNVEAAGFEKRVELTWDAVKNADGYYIHRYSPNSEPELVDESTENNAIVSGLENGKTYSFYVKAYRFVDEAYHVSEEYSTLVSATPAVVLPGTPTITTRCENQSIVITFGNQISYRKPGEMHGYNLYRYDAAQNQFVLIQTLDANATYCTDTNLEIGASYHYRLTTFKEYDGEVYESETVFFSESYRAFEPEMPTEVEAKTKLLVTTLSWVPGELTAGFELYKLDNISGEWIYIGETNTNSFNVWSTKTDVTYKIVPYSLFADMRYYNLNTDGVIIAS